jgi:hypothetical protein
MSTNVTNNVIILAAADIAQEIRLTRNHKHRYHFVQDQFLQECPLQ